MLYGRLSVMQIPGKSNVFVVSMEIAMFKWMTGNFSRLVRENQDKGVTKSWTALVFVYKIDKMYSYKI